MKRFVSIAVVLLAIGLVFAAACSSDSNDNGNNGTDSTPDGGSQVGSFADNCQKTGEKQFSAAPAMIIDTSKTYIATISTEKGDIVVEIDNTHAITANNFIFLACKGYYDGLTFHRVEPGFVIQGGDPTGTGSGGPGYTIVGEFEGSNFVEGVIGMARATDPNSAGSQFYIMIGDSHSLDGAYADFGHVTSGQDVAAQIAVGDVMNTITIEER